MRITDVTLKDIRGSQKDIMLFVGDWVRTEKTPIPRMEIVKNMEDKGIKSYTTAWAIAALLRKGYLRKAVVFSNKTYYVQLRGI